ncbi:MAG: PHP domain-containing protein [Saprospiraceae bacterium]
MLSNKEIAKAFQLLGNIMELHGENPFKIRSYQNAYVSLRKTERPLSEMSDAEIAAIKGVGDNIAAKIRELLNTGQMAALEKYKATTPGGVQDMLTIKGFGPKKVLAVWKELGVETAGELLYAVNENRLVELKGFGPKSQEELKKLLEYFLRSKDKFHYGGLYAPAGKLVQQLSAQFPDAKVSLCGAIRRCEDIVDRIEILLGWDGEKEALLQLPFLQEATFDEYGISGRMADEELPVTIFHCPEAAFGSKLFRYTGSTEFLEAFVGRFPGLDFKDLPEERLVFEKAGIEFIEPELRSEAWSLSISTQPKLIEAADIKGVIHTHTTYSDGQHTLREMALHAKSLGYGYIGITDHSKAAFYANGLQPERVLQQMAEIDQLNLELAPFRIFKGIESDILNDGALDYEEGLLKQFDFIIASVHSNLRMDEEKATRRLLAAIENPYTTILGHPTGRLLLSRPGYPIDHKKVIDACAANRVAIEINASPYRLDLDWRWIPYALEKGVLLSINPDAHSKEGIGDILYGVCAARKGGLGAEYCLNTRDAAGFQALTAR